jgi:asparagine synthase (glutamine-hydrolysing)
VAKTLGIINKCIERTPEQFVNAIPMGVVMTDGMVPWIHYHNLPFVLEDLSGSIDILVNTSGQGEMFGDDLSGSVELLIGTRSLMPEDDPIKILYNSIAVTDPRMVEALFASSVNVDAYKSLKREYGSTSSLGERNRVQEVIYKNRYPNLHFRTKYFQGGIRFPLVNTRLLDTLSKMPGEYKRRIMRLGPRNIYSATSKAKVELVHRLDGGLEDIPYERTSLPPKRSMFLHTCAYLLNELDRRNQGDDFDRWMRENKAFREFLRNLLDRLLGRGLFDAQAIEAIWKGQLSGENNASLLSALTTIELWYELFLDPIKHQI